MVALHTLLALCAISGVGETVLLDFSAPWCGPCRQMEPTIHRLASQGYPVRQINIDTNRQLAQQYRVTSVPCFVMIAGGQEVERVVGATSHDRLLRMFKTARFTPASAATDQVRTQSPDGASSGNILSKAWTSLAGSNRNKSAPVEVTQVSSAPRRDVVSVNQTTLSAEAERRALWATVRLKVEDSRGYSYGAGTIIDMHGSEALVLTCGHIFRESTGKGRITVEMFVPGANGSVEGHLIAYDAQRRDIGLVSFRPGIDVSPVQVGSARIRPVDGDDVFSVGCDHGAAPSVRRSKITSLNRYTGPPNIEVAGRPVEGRSGGGLFTANGQLIGVCNLADPTDNEGIYASLETVHWQLDRIGHSEVYRRATETVAQNQSGAARLLEVNNVAAPPLMPRTMPRSSSINHLNDAGAINSQAVALREVAQQTEGTQIICIVRSKNDPQGSGRVIVLDQPSAEFLRQLSQENSTPTWNPSAVVRASGVLNSSPANASPRADSLSGGRGQVMRGQSSE